VQAHPSGTPQAGMPSFYTNSHQLSNDHQSK
jgi:hypothetical protein